MESEEKDTKYNRRYHLQRALKPVLRIDSHKRTIYVPQGQVLNKTDRKRVEALVSDYNYVIQASAFPVENYEKVMISRSVGIRGKHIAFGKEKLHSVSPGTEIVQIGKGKDSVVNRIDKFSLPGKYVGTLTMDGEKYYAIQAHPDVMPGAKLHHYILYQSNGVELSRKMYGINCDYDYTRYYQPVFKLAKPVEKAANQEKLNFK